jgi:hypothetical protein
MVDAKHALAPITLAVALTASGGALGAASFRSRYLPARYELITTERAVLSAATHAGNKSDRFVQGEFAGLTQRADMTARHLAALHPPTKPGRVGLAALVRSVRDQVGDLQAISVDARHHNAAKAGRDGSRLGGELVKANDALRRLDGIVGG